ncbi:hypothetical protein M8J76_016553 [Diaphorina citri]|nr:hypothetical protein M8J76_016553 [Diaphorina citri]
MGSVHRVSTHHVPGSSHVDTVPDLAQIERPEEEEEKKKKKEEEEEKKKKKEEEEKKKTKKKKKEEEEKKKEEEEEEEEEKKTTKKKKKKKEKEEEEEDCLIQMLSLDIGAKSDSDCPIMSDGHVMRVSFRFQLTYLNDLLSQTCIGISDRM